MNNIQRIELSKLLNFNYEYLLVSLDINKIFRYYCVYIRQYAYLLFL